MNSKAWEILLDEEKSALSLSINHNKSTWQAGEILGKAHYKYLEIQQRAITFFKMFTLYFEKTNNQMIPPNSELQWDFREYIQCTVEHRMGYRETLKMIGRESELAHKNSGHRIKVLTQHMEELAKNKDPLHQELYDLIKEFDRWNNFRILPENLQEPSAFKRRNKTRLLKHLNNMRTLDKFLVDRLHDKFTAKKSYKYSVIYLPLVSEHYDNGYEVLTIMDRPKIITYISKELNLYLFKDKDEADDYGFLVENYLNLGKKNCKQGQQFWPEYRQLIKRAYNYNLLNNIIPRRTNLENAFRSIDKAVIAKNLKPATMEMLNKGKHWDL